MIVLIVVAPMYIPIGDIKLYQALGYAIKFGVAKKSFYKNKNGNSHISTIIPYASINDNCINQKDGTFTGVIEIKPIEFNMLSENKQNFLIDGIISNTLKNVGIFQEYDLIKLEKPIIFDNYLKNELNRIQKLIAENENKNLTEDEFRKRVEIIEDRMNLIDSLNTNEKIYASAYYIALHDISKQSLENSLEIIEQTLNNGSLEAKRLNDKELAIFLKYSYDKEFDEREFDNFKKSEYLHNIYPESVQFKTLSTKQNGKILTHFVITDFPLKVENAWGQQLFDIPNTKVVMKCKPVEKYKAIKRIDNAINEILSQNTLGKASSQIDRQTHLESLQILLEGLQNDNEVFFDTTLMITSYDSDKNVENKKYVRRKLRELGFKFSEMFGRQIESYFSSNINNYNKTNISRGFNSSIIASCFPFVSNAILDDNGLLIGENKLPTFVDFFRRDEERVNSNTVIIGKPGSGKSYATKMLLAQLASDNAGKLPVIRDALLRSEKHYNKRFDVVFDLDATSPLRLVSDITEAYHQFVRDDNDILITAAPARKSPYFNLIEVFEKNGTPYVDLSKRPKEPILRRQDSPKCYDMNASIYIWKREALLENDSVFVPNTGLFVMPEERSVDIDTPLDFMFVEFMLTKTNNMAMGGGHKLNYCPILSSFQQFDDTNSLAIDSALYPASLAHKACLTEPKHILDILQSEHISSYTHKVA